MPYPCCCRGNPCTNYCTTGVPTTMSISIASFLDGVCTGATGLNGTYIIDLASCLHWFAGFSTPVLPVNTATAFNPPSCTSTFDAYNLRIDLRAKPTWDATQIITLNAQWTGTISGVTYNEIHRWTATSPTWPTDCCSWTTESMTYSHAVRWRNETPFLSDFSGDGSSSTADYSAGAGGC